MTEQRVLRTSSKRMPPPMPSWIDIVIAANAGQTREARLPGESIARQRKRLAEAKVNADLKKFEAKVITPTMIQRMTGSSNDVVKRILDAMVSEGKAMTVPHPQTVGYWIHKNRVISD